MRDVAGPKSRALLAALLLEAGRVVSVESLKDALWGGAPPPSAHASLHNHVTRLRRLLDEPDRLRTVPTGYLLRVEEGELDVHVFESLVARARVAHARGEWARVVSEAAAALSLWRGAPSPGSPPNWAATRSPSGSRRRGSSSWNGGTTPSWPSGAADWPRWCRSWRRWSPSTRCGRRTTVS